MGRTIAPEELFRRTGMPLLRFYTSVQLLIAAYESEACCWICLQDST